MSKTTGVKPVDDGWQNPASRQITVILQKVKMKLISRELKEQKEAVAWLVNELNVNSKVGQDLLIVMLLKSEIIALLCETTLTMEGHLVTSTLKCLASLTTSEQFYRQNHASYVVASILRTGHFVRLKTGGQKDRLVMLESIAHTLEKVFEGATSFGVPLNEICELNQMLEFFKILLTADSQAYRIIFSAAKIVSLVLQRARDEDVGKVVEDGDLLVTVVETTLNIMRRVTEANNPNDGKYAFRAMVMTCAVCAAGIQLCARNDDRHVDEVGLPQSINYRGNLAVCIHLAMMKSVIPNLNKIELDEKNGQFYAWFVASLNGIYQLEQCCLTDLSNYLAEQGFLQTLPRLATLPTQNLRSETLLLLSRILATLATLSLSADTWLGGVKQFQKFLANAFKSLPLDPTTWLPFLSEGDERADALLVLFYYNFLVESLSNAALYLPLIVAYVMMSSARQKTKRKSVTMQKALWFTFSIAAVSHDDASSVESYETALARLFDELESADIKQCYTHHPAVVVHCLRSTFVSDKLRGSVISLWLEEGGDVGCLVDATVDGNLTNYYCLMEMVKKGSPETVDVAVEAISELFKNPEIVEGLGNLAWEILHQMLASGYERDGYNTMSVLKLAAMFEPSEISGTLLIRVLYQLINFIIENQSDDLTLVALGIRNAYCLLSLSIHRNNIRGVITMFTNKPKLIKILQTLAYAKNDADLSYTCFNCLSTLLRYQTKYSIQCENSLEIEFEDLLKQLYFEDCLGALLFATALFTNEIERPVIVLREISSGSNYDDVIRAMYLQLHVIHSKNGSEGRDLCYTLLVGLLSHCSTVNNIKALKTLCELEWTHLLIKMTIEGNQEMDREFMNFASEWLSHRYSVLPISAPNGDRILCRDQFEITLDLLGRTALNNLKIQPEEVSLKKLVQSLMLFQNQFSDNIGAKLQQADTQLAES